MLDGDTGGSFSCAEAFALAADIVSEQCSEYEVFFGGEAVQWSVDKHLYCFKTFCVAEVQVYVVFSGFLNKVFNFLTF